LISEGERGSFLKDGKMRVERIKELAEKEMKEESELCEQLLGQHPEDLLVQWLLLISLSLSLFKYLHLPISSFFLDLFHRVNFLLMRDKDSDESDTPRFLFS
jgi:hypothetical protein